MQTTTHTYHDSLVLASGSPRRIEMLKRLGFSLHIEPADVDEAAYDHMPIPRRVIALAELKARAGSAKAPFPPLWTVAADTLISLGGEAFGKPADESDAKAMLKALSGRMHTVWSGLCVIDRRSGVSRTAVSETDIWFAELSGREIDDYIASGEWNGAAGAYKAQERGAFLIEKMSGSFSGVVGLPLREFYAILSEIGYPLSV